MTVASSGCFILVAFTLAKATAAEGVHHYVFFNRDRERISDPAFVRTKALEGAQLKYTWRELEREKDVYDFSAVRHDLALLKANGKRLFIQLQDSSFDPAIVNVPRYLVIDSRYGGGADKQYGIQGDDEEHAVPEGWVARRWDAAVQHRLHKLFAALGQEFDGKIEGVNLAETAVSFGESGRLFPKGFTPAGYRDAVITNMTNGRFRNQSSCCTPTSCLASGFQKRISPISAACIAELKNWESESVVPIYCRSSPDK